MLGQIPAGWRGEHLLTDITRRDSACQMRCRLWQVECETACLGIDFELVYKAIDDALQVSVLNINNSCLMDELTLSGLRIVEVYAFEPKPYNRVLRYQSDNLNFVLSHLELCCKNLFALLYLFKPHLSSELTFTESFQNQESGFRKLPVMLSLTLTLTGFKRLKFLRLTRQRLRYFRSLCRACPVIVLLIFSYQLHSHHITSFRC